MRVSELWREGHHNHSACEEDATGLIFIENFLKVVLLSGNGGQMVNRVVREIRVSWTVAPILGS